MKNDTGLTEASRQYAAAYAAHYGTKNLREALEFYKGIVAAHPDSQEAGYSRSQIQNIVTSVVPKKELLDAAVDLALACFEREKSNGREAGSGHATRSVGFQLAYAARPRPTRWDPASFRRSPSGGMRARQVSSTTEEGD
ncbi:MAG: hypothetical protein EP299_05835 [Acidobacteria bacterium]|nr:MAG: hypothetical protein EP299_05835 [Acidobacteriota bacterium]